MPSYYASGQWATLTFPIQYASTNWLDLSQLTYQGGTLIGWDNTPDQYGFGSACFLVQVSPNVTYAVSGDSFGYPGGYTMKWVYDDVNGTHSIEEQDVEGISIGGVGIAPVNLVVSPNPFTNCVGTTQGFTASGAPGTFTYSWSASGATMVGSPTGSQNANATFLFSTPGTATITAQAGPLSTTANGTIIGPTNILHVTLASCPADTSRTTIGVGEQLTLTLSPDCGTPIWWVLSGDGTLSAMSGNPVTFTAGDQAGSPIVIGTEGGVSQSVTFNVIPPSNVQFTKDGGDRHLQYFTSAGFLAHVKILPTTVSFGAIHVREDSAPLSSASGVWTTMGTHPQGDWEAINDDNTLGTSDGDDHVAAWSSGVQPGGFTWSIPVRYAVDTSGNGYVFWTYDQVFTADNNGTAVQSKNGVLTAPMPVDAPTDWPF